MFTFRTCIMNQPAGRAQCPLGLQAAMPARSRQAGPQNDNKDWFDCGSKMQKLVMCVLKVVQQME